MPYRVLLLVSSSERRSFCSSTYMLASCLWLFSSVTFVSKAYICMLDIARWLVICWVSSAMSFVLSSWTSLMLVCSALRSLSISWSKSVLPADSLIVVLSFNSSARTWRRFSYISSLVSKTVYCKLSFSYWIDRNLRSRSAELSSVIIFSSLTVASSFSKS